MTRMPDFNENLEPTKKQVEVRNLFAEAAAYAKGAIADAELKKEYQKKAKPGRSAYNIAFRDCLKAPVVQSINPDQYTGTPGSKVEISAKDDFRVVAVTVSIYTVGGILVEQGNAILNPVNRNKWTYTATQTNDALPGSVIKATAFDLPGNKGTLEIDV